jgi:hypothetical protein
LSSLFRYHLLLGLLLFCFQGAAQQARLESEYKLDVPRQVEKKLWAYLKSDFESDKLDRFLPGLTSNTSVEVFYDEYFDDAAYSLAAMQGGVRVRKRYVNDTLVRQLLQVKLAVGDSTGVAREEIKFDVNEKLDLSDRRAMHPFWKHVKPGDRGELSRLLASQRLQGDELQVATSLKQVRSRLYIQEHGEALMTITLDEVKATSPPYVRFTELEMELNEVRYTLADEAERARMEELNRELKEEILSRFPELSQDQTPKYNKLLRLQQANPWKPVMDNLAYGLLALLVAVAVYLYIRYEKR